MDSFCTNCGTPIPEGAVKCASCGKEFVQEQNQQPTQEQQPVQEQPQSGDPQSAQTPIAPEKKITKPMLYGIIAGAAAVVILFIIIIVSVAGNNYKKAIDNYMDVWVYGKDDKIEKLAPKEYWDYLEEELDTDIQDKIDEFEAIYDFIADTLEEDYGKNIKVRYKITDKKDLSEKKLTTLRDNLKDNFDIAKKSVTKAYQVEAEVTLKGSDDEDTKDIDFIIVKIGSDWYICTESGNFFLDAII